MYHRVFQLFSNGYDLFITLIIIEFYKGQGDLWAGMRIAR